MKPTKSIIFILGLALGLVTLMSSTCNTSGDDQPDPNCNGFAQATLTGYINDSYCFDSNPQYTYDEENQRLNFSSIVTINDIIYSCSVSVYPYTGTQSYSCDADNPGYVEFIVHGDNNEFYKSQSGTLSITKADANHLEASFNVTAKGYYSDETVNIVGSVMKVQ